MSREIPKSKAEKYCESVLAESRAYSFMTHPDLYSLVERFISGEILRHEWLEKTELLKEQIVAQHSDEHRSGAV